MRWLPLLLLGTAAAAPAAERKLFVSAFDRVRVNGSFRVEIVTGGAPRGTLSGDPRRLDGVEVKQEGSTLYVRRNSGRWDEQPRGPAGQPVTVTLATPTLAGAYLIGPGALAVTGMKGDRLDLSIAGTGSISVADAQGRELNATTIGTGRIAVAGRAGKARLLVNGAGGVDAGKLETDELTVRLDGPGEVAGRARYTATLVNTGLGRIAVTGTAKCLVKAQAGGPVTCGAAASAR